MKTIKTQLPRRTQKHVPGYVTANDELPFEFFVPAVFPVLKRSRNKSFLRSSSKKAAMAI